MTSIAVFFRYGWGSTLSSRSRNGQQKVLAGGQEFFGIPESGKRLSSLGTVRRRRCFGRGRGTENVSGVRPAERRASGQQRQELLAGLVQVGLEHEGVLGRDQEVAEPTGAAMDDQQAVAHAQSVEPFLAPNTWLGGNVLDVIEANSAHRQAQPGHLQMPGGDAVVDPGRGPQQQQDEQQAAANGDRNFDFSCIHFLCPSDNQSNGSRRPKPSDSQTCHRGPIIFEAKTMPSATILLHATRFVPPADDTAKASSRRLFLPGRIDPWASASSGSPTSPLRLVLPPIDVDDLMQVSCDVEQKQWREEPAREQAPAAQESRGRPATLEARSLIVSGVAARTARQGA